MDTSKPSQTEAAIRAAIHQVNQSTKPEWVRIPEAVRIFGLCRSSIYELIAAGTIKSTALRKRGATRGIRIISYDSLASYIERAASEGGVARDE